MLRFHARLCLLLASLLCWVGCGETAALDDAALGDSMVGADASAPDADLPDGAAVPDAATVPDAGPVAGELPGNLGPAERPARLSVPAAHDGVTPLPVLVSLHGYGGSGTLQNAFLGIARAGNERGMYVITPDGTPDSSSRRFWNATPACCDFAGDTVDDVAYLTSLLDELEALAPVSDIYFFGHSNGGFMSYRMACELSPRISAIVSLAGSDYISESSCVPSEPVSVLQIHGDADATISYLGSGGYPSAAATVARWAARASCSSEPQAGEALDLESSISGAETSVSVYADGCSGAEAALWTMAGGGHIPSVSPAFMPAVLDWLSAHAR